MSRESFAYRQTLAGILESSGGKHLLSIAEVKRYSGISNYRAIKKRFPFRDNYISAEVLAMHLCGGGEQ